MATSAHRARVLDLEALPTDMQATIAAQVAAPEPPPRWLRIGPGGWIQSRGWWEWHWQRGMDPGSRRESLPAGMRAAVIARDGLVCQICGGDVEPDDVHIDHIVPYSKGGQHVLSNLQVAHSLCNLRKGAKV